jgi:hypothetical protein
VVPSARMPDNRTRRQLAIRPYLQSTHAHCAAGTPSQASDLPTQALKQITEASTKMMELG